MRNLLFVIGILLLCETGMCRKASVSLCFENAAGKEILLFRPVNYNLLGVTDTIRPGKKKSVYRFSIKIDRIAPMRLIIDKRIVDLLLVPGERLSVVCDLNRPQLLSRVEGKNARGEELYNQLSVQKDIYRYEWIRTVKYPLDTIPENVERNFRTLEQKEIARFDSLYQQGKIDRAFFDYVVKDIRMYYSATLSKIARSLVESRYEKAFGEFWTRLYDEHPLQEKDINSFWFQAYANVYLQFYIPYKEKTRININSEKEYYAFIYQFYNEHLSNPVLLEAVLGNKLFELALNNDTGSPDLITYFDRFNRQFPGNPYTERFLPYIKQLEDFQEKTKKGFSSEVRFVENDRPVCSWEELMSKFKGKPVFIDFWFSTCGPCREEFKYAPALEKFLTDHRIEMLYISVDDEKMEGNWKNSIKYFDLKGWHLRASKEFDKDFRAKFGINSFPTYMLVDADGKVLLPKARRPSAQGELYKQIEAALK